MNSFWWMNMSNEQSDALPPGTELRIARSTKQLDALASMYQEGLGLKLLGSFEDHAGHSGVMLGASGLGYHLEFTCEAGAEAGPAPDDDHLLVFYLPDRDVWHHRCQSMIAAGFAAVAPHNQYWAEQGRSFEDVDGYRVVIQNSLWE